MCCKICLERVGIHCTAKAIGSLREDREAIPTICKEGIHCDSVVGRRVDRYSIEHDRRGVNLIARRPTQTP